jgi:hypothetical protein
MTTATTIVQVCEAITEALRDRGFFEAEREDEARAGMVAPALEAASAKLGARLTVSGQREDGGCTVMTEGVPGLVTIVPRRRVEHAGKGGAEDSVNPDFGVTWALA